MELANKPVRKHGFSMANGFNPLQFLSWVYMLADTVLAFCLIHQLDSNEVVLLY